MRNSNGSKVNQKDHVLKTENDSLQAESKVSSILNSSELEFLSYVKFHGIDELIHSLKMIHDFALYHTDLCFDAEEKNALFNVKILWEELEQINKS